jgi:hypothetical protein
MIIFITSFPGYSGFNKIIMDTIGQFIKFLYIKLQIVDALSLFNYLCNSEILTSILKFLSFFSKTLALTKTNIFFYFNLVILPEKYNQNLDKKGINSMQVFS